MAFDDCENQNLGTQSIVFQNQLFTFNGSAITERYDPVFDSWSRLKHLKLSSSSTQVTVVRAQIYAIALDRSTNKSTIERYSVASCSWEKNFTSHEGCRNFSCVVGASDCMYVLGGAPLQQELEYVAKAERFDTVQNKWEEIADMQQETEVMPLVWQLKERFLLLEGTGEGENN